MSDETIDKLLSCFEDAVLDDPSNYQAARDAIHAHVDAAVQSAVEKEREEIASRLCDEREHLEWERNDERKWIATCIRARTNPELAREKPPMNSDTNTVCNTNGSPASGTEIPEPYATIIQEARSLTSGRTYSADSRVDRVDTIVWLADKLAELKAKIPGWMQVLEDQRENMTLLKAERSRAEQADQARYVRMLEEAHVASAKISLLKSQLSTLQEAAAQRDELIALVREDWARGRAEVDKMLASDGYDSMRFADTRHGWLFSTGKTQEWLRKYDESISPSGASA